MSAWLCSSISSRWGHSMFHGIAEAVQRSDTGIAAPREHQPPRASRADELVVNQVGRHSHERQVAAFLTDHFVSGGKRNEMGKSFHRDDVAIMNQLGNRLLQCDDLRHRSETPRSFRPGSSLPHASRRHMRAARAEAGTRRPNGHRGSGAASTSSSRKNPAPARHVEGRLPNSRPADWCRHTDTTGRARATGATHHEPQGSVPWRRSAARCARHRRPGTDVRTASARRQSCACSSRSSR